MIAGTAFALLCLTQVALGTSDAQFNGRYYAQNGMNYRNNWNNFYSGESTGAFQMRPEDQAAIDAIGPQGIEDGKKALNIATELVKGIFPSEGPIVRNGAIQTKWGNYALPNPQDSDIIDKLLQATRDMIRKIPIIE